MKPALTAAEWKAKKVDVDAHHATIDGSGATWVGYEYNDEVSWHPRRHAVAALALHEQPFGFTREDVEQLRILEYTHIWPISGKAAHLADRIDALLPPE